MQRIVGLAVALCALLLAPAAALAAAPPPGAVISDNLDYAGGISDPGTVDGAFDKVRGQDLLITTGRFGLKTWDLSDPAKPRLLDQWLPAEVLGPAGFWQNEDVDIDTKRKLIIASLDPRHNDVEQGKCPGIGTLAAKTRNPECDAGFYVVSYANPADLRQVGDFIELDAGHTSTCIDDCRWIWTGGPAKRSDMTDLNIWSTFTAGGRGDGRPIYVTDLRDPANPKVQKQPIDLYRNDGATDYSHDVQVDEQGIAWTSGRGGVLGYATKGYRRDPRTGVVRLATPGDPVLVAGGGIEGVAKPEFMFMHNSLRPTKKGVAAAGVERGNILISTEEQFGGPCGEQGRVVFNDLTDSWGGAGAATSTPEKPYRMKALDSFHPALADGAGLSTSTVCSAHYFELAGSTLATTWYGQGTRFLDVSDARDVRQVGFFRVDGPGAGTAYAVRFKKGLFYVFDITRGIDILRFDGDVHQASKMKRVAAPAVKASDEKFAARIASAGPRDQLVCPLVVPAAD